MKKKHIPCSADIQWPAGARIYLSVDSAELGLDDYNVRISTQGTLLDPVLSATMLYWPRLMKSMVTIT